MSEARFTWEVLALARELGLLAHWCQDSRRCAGDRGFPDLIAADPRGLLLAELKMPGGETSAEQDLWAWTLTKASVEDFDPQALRYRLWTPADLEDGTIERELRRLA